MNRHVDDLLDAIPSGQAVDLQPLLFRFTLDTSTALLFGRSVDSLKSRSGDDGESPINVAFTAAQQHLTWRGALAGARWLPGGSKFRRDCAQVHDFLDSIIIRALEADEAVKCETQDQKGSSFIDGLMRETRDRVELRSACLHILLAGRDSTACLLSWTL